MKTKIIEATSNGINFGKFMLGRFDEAELAVRSSVEPPLPVVRARGWDPEAHLWVMDLQTGEGACFRPGGSAKADLDKHSIWVCVLFLPFLEWLYKQDLTDLDALPALIDLPDAENALYGYRRPGPEAWERDCAIRHMEPCPTRDEHVAKAIEEHKIFEEMASDGATARMVKEHQEDFPTMSRK